MQTVKIIRDLLRIAEIFLQFRYKIANVSSKDRLYFKIFFVKSKILAVSNVVLLGEM